jgi:Tol biopolymer transport system component
MLVAQVIIIIYTSSVFLLLPLHSNQYAFGTLAGANEKIVFYSNRDGNQEIYIMNAADGSNQTRLTNDPAWDSLPSWSPDGTLIAFYSERDVGGDIYIMNAADGSNLIRLTDSPAWDSFPSWSPNATNIEIAFDSDRDANQEIYIMKFTGGVIQTSRLTFNNVTDTGSSWSPDGTKLAFASSKDGNSEIYVMKAADGSGQIRLTNNTAADGEPDW